MQQFGRCAPQVSTPEDEGDASPIFYLGLGISIGKSPSILNISHGRYRKECRFLGMIMRQKRLPAVLRQSPDHLRELPLPGNVPNVIGWLMPLHGVRHKIISPYVANDCRRARGLLNLCVARKNRSLYELAFDCKVCNPI